MSNQTVINGVVVEEYCFIICASGDVHRSRVTEVRINNPLAGKRVITVTGVPHVFSVQDFVTTIRNGEHVIPVNKVMFRSSILQPILQLDSPCTIDANG